MKIRRAYPYKSQGSEFEAFSYKPEIRSDRRDTSIKGNSAENANSRQSQTNQLKKRSTNCGRQIYSPAGEEDYPDIVKEAEARVRQRELEFNLLQKN